MSIAKCKSLSGRHKFSREIIFDREGKRTQKCIHCGKPRRAPEVKQ
jgi:uncharacterized Zn finger protein